MSTRIAQVTARGTAPTLFSIDGSSIEQRGYKKAHWKNCDSVVGMKSIGSTMVESSVLFPVASAFESGSDGTSVTFPCSGDYFLIDSHCRYRNLQEFHGWKFKIDMDLVGCTQIGESRSRTNRL